MKGTFPRGKKLYPAHYALLYSTKGSPKTFNRDVVRVPVPICRHCKKDVKDYGGHRKYLNPLGRKPHRYLGRHGARPAHKIQGPLGCQ